MKNFIVFSSLLILFLHISSAMATSVKSKTQLGAGGYDETIAGEGDLIEGSRSKKTDDWAWSMEFEFSQTPSTDAFGNPDIEHSYNTEPEIEFSGSTGFGIDGIYNYSQTPEESLTNSGPEVDLSYELELNKNIKDEDAFMPTLKFKPGGKYQLYVQSFSGTTAPTKNGTTRPTTGFNVLRQISSIGALSFDPAEFISVDFTFTYYFYDRNVAAFLNYINSPSSVRLGGNGFASSITNFAQSSLDLAVTMEPFTYWSIYLELINSVSAVDISMGWSYEGMIYRELGDWKAGLGCERVTSPSLGNNIYGLVTVSYNL